MRKVNEMGGKRGKVMKGKGVNWKEREGAVRKGKEDSEGAKGMKREGKGEKR